MHQKVSKEILVQWVSLGLKKALSVHNITKGFESTGIYPLNQVAVQSKLAPSQNFEIVEIRDGGTLLGGVAQASRQLIRWPLLRSLTLHSRSSMTKRTRLRRSNQ
jgi:hypothetical protein